MRKCRRAVGRDRKKERDGKGRESMEKEIKKWKRRERIGRHPPRRPPPVSPGPPPPPSSRFCPRAPAGRGAAGPYLAGRPCEPNPRARPYSQLPPLLRAPRHGGAAPPRLRISVTSARPAPATAASGTPLPGSGAAQRPRAAPREWRFRCGRKRAGRGRGGAGTAHRTGTGCACAKGWPGDSTTERGRVFK